MRLNQRKFLAYTATFLVIAFLIAMGQNYIRYGASPHYQPWRSVIYLCISILVFVPILPVFIRITKSTKSKLNAHFGLVSMLLIIFTLALFFFISSVLMHAFGYYDNWISATYAKGYLGREAIWHLLALLACTLFVRYSTTHHPITHLACSLGRKKVNLPLKNIEWIETADHYLQLHTLSESYLKRATLEQMTKQLAPDFFRIHRRYLINSAAVSHAEQEGKAFFLLLKSGTRLRVGKSYQAQIKARFFHDN